MKYNIPNQSTFKERRLKLNLTMQMVADYVNTSKATICRLEKGKEIKYSTVKKVSDYYSIREA